MKRSGIGMPLGGGREAAGVGRTESISCGEARKPVGNRLAFSFVAGEGLEPPASGL